VRVVYRTENGGVKMGRHARVYSEDELAKMPIKSRRQRVAYIIRASELSYQQIAEELTDKLPNNLSNKNRRVSKRRVTEWAKFDNGDEMPSKYSITLEDILHRPRGTISGKVPIKERNPMAYYRYLLEQYRKEGEQLAREIEERQKEGKKYRQSFTDEFLYSETAAIQNAPKYQAYDDIMVALLDIAASIRLDLEKLPDGRTAIFISDNNEMGAMLDEWEEQRREADESDDFSRLDKWRADLHERSKYYDVMGINKQAIRPSDCPNKVDAIPLDRTISFEFHTE